MANPTHATFRDSIRKRSPPWLRRGLAERILYSLAVHLDILGDAVAAGVKLRFPGVYSADSLPYLGRERRMSRGRTELDAAYATRLDRWLTDHRMRGGPYALLAQIHAHYAPNNFPVELIYYSGRRFSMDVAGNVTRDDIAWTPDANAAKWARWWLVYHTDLWAAEAPTDDEIEDLRLVPRQWNAAHCQGHIVLFPSDAELWNYPTGHVWNESGVWNTSGTARFLTIEDLE
jgi:hypothetical protein